MTTTVETTRSSIALWKNRKADSKVLYQGNVQITPELLSELLAQSPDNRGYHNLRVVLFLNDSENPKAPGVRGLVELPQQEEF